MGRTSAAVFVREGAKVLAADVTGRQDETAAELGAAVVPCACDVSVEDDAVAMPATAIETFGRVDAVLNVAGIGNFTMFADLDVSEYDQGVRRAPQGGPTRDQTRDPVEDPQRWRLDHQLVVDRRSRCVGRHQRLQRDESRMISFTKSAAIEYGTQGIRANARSGSDARGARRRRQGARRGQSLIPVLALRLAYPEHLVDITRIVELKGIERQADDIRVGAGTTEATSEHDRDDQRYRVTGSPTKRTSSSASGGRTTSGMC